MKSLPYILGQIVLNQTTPEPKLNLNDKKAGVYFVNVKGNLINGSFKIIKD
ncbi:MAG: T9SS type A sorting domain-containing protein [Bacteroidota bacterium]|nr:T9SS type A sorting domain-containing protein [Bacteroidota bacterium]